MNIQKGLRNLDLTQAEKRKYLDEMLTTNELAKQFGGSEAQINFWLATGQINFMEIMKAYVPTLEFEKAKYEYVIEQLASVLQQSFAWKPKRQKDKDFLKSRIIYWLLESGSFDKTEYGKELVKLAKAQDYKDIIYEENYKNNFIIKI